ncbi:MAG: chemotaxis protein CheD [Xanthomonadaceae bacterium]|nr:chemotaxis protein CheD [Xanthomonadaceae bacterium]MDE1962309.1 chemotaxis protein CheD [Xanthomonadaceae bacterium]
MNGRDVHVRMCEARVGHADEILRTTLGSCVGIGLLWRERQRCALAHCLLPEPPGDAAPTAAKYVTDAVPTLLRLIGIEPAQHGQLEAVVAGGACMVRHDRPAPYGLIGEQNTEMAQRLLAAAGIRVVHTDTGGSNGRQLSIDCRTQHYAVRTFERLH